MKDVQRGKIDAEAGVKGEKGSRGLPRNSAHMGSSFAPLKSKARTRLDASSRQQDSGSRRQVAHVVKQKKRAPSAARPALKI